MVRLGLRMCFIVFNLLYLISPRPASSAAGVDIVELEGSGDEEEKVIVPLRALLLSEHSKAMPPAERERMREMGGGVGCGGKRGRGE